MNEVRPTWYQPDEKGRPKLLALREINPNAAFIVDSDRGIKRAQWMWSHKEEISQICKQQKLYFWMVDRTIENLIPKKDRSRAKWPPRSEKVHCAELYAQKIKGKTLSEVTGMKSPLRKHIVALFQCIRKWAQARRAGSRRRKHRER